MFGNETNDLKSSLIISVDQREKWERALGCFPVRDIYFTSDYHRLCELDTGRQAAAYFHELGEHRLFFPFLIGAIPKVGGQSTLYDLESCYGYSGPLATTSDKNLLESLWQPFIDWCQQYGVVAGFTRCHPFLGTEKYFSSLTRTIHNRDTVFINLEVTEEELWDSYPPNQRTRIRKAISNGLCFRHGKQSEIIDVFVPLYNASMERLGAGSRYYFNQEYFQFLSNQLDNQVDLLIVEKDDSPVAAAIFFKGDGIYHYHLGASLPEAFNWRPNNLLFHQASLLGKSQGFKRLHLGGGRSAAEDDSLLRFKGSFSDRRVSFYIGQSIFQPVLYKSLCQDWLDRQGTSVVPSDLLFYRNPLPVINGNPPTKVV